MSTVTHISLILEHKMHKITIHTLTYAYDRSLYDDLVSRAKNYKPSHVGTPVKAPLVQVMIAPGNPGGGGGFMVKPWLQTTAHCVPSVIEFARHWAKPLGTLGKVHVTWFGVAINKNAY